MERLVGTVEGVFTVEGSGRIVVVVMVVMGMRMSVSAMGKVLRVFAVSSVLMRGVEVGIVIGAVAFLTVMVVAIPIGPIPVAAVMVMVWGPARAAVNGAISVVVAAKQAVVWRLKLREAIPLLSERVIAVALMIGVRGMIGVRWVIAVVGTAWESRVRMVAAGTEVAAKWVPVMVIVFAMKRPMIGGRGMVMAVLSQRMHGALFVVSHGIVPEAPAARGTRRTVRVRVIVTVTMRVGMGVGVG